MSATETDQITVHSADVVVPVVSPALDNGAVAVQDGKILVVGSRDHVMDVVAPSQETRWDGVLMPGLVNAHAHLQYHGMAELGQAVHADFEAWSVAFDDMYDSIHESEDWSAAAIAGASEALRQGTTTIADICTDLGAVDALPRAGLSGISFFETLGHTAEQWAQSERSVFLDSLDAFAPLLDAGFRVGVSPHAPYSIDTAVLADVAEIGRALGLRVHTHLGESTFEDDYYRTGTGPLADFVATFGRDFEILTNGGVGKSAGEFAFELGLLGDGCHVAHGIYLGSDDRKLLRDTGTAVALCPRSNATIGLDEAPVADYLAEGNHICIGTDSLSSSPSLDLLEDLKALHDIATRQGYTKTDLAHRLLRAATIDGAKAIGMDVGEFRVGALEPGRQANVAVLALDTEAHEAEQEIVARGAGACVATIVGGDVARRGKARLLPNQGV